jgi:hypothetical protein
MNQSKRIEELEWQLSRAKQLSADAVAVCERRTAERDHAWHMVRAMADSNEASLGSAMLDLEEQIIRLRNTSCTTMGFGFMRADLLNALKSEAEELRRESIGSPEAGSETRDVFTIAMHIAIESGQLLTDVATLAAHKLKTRLDFVDAGGTWTGAKIKEIADKS